MSKTYDPEYMRQHAKVRKERGSPWDYQCVDGDHRAEQWTFNNYGDRNNVWDYDPRCPACHVKYDLKGRSMPSGENHWRAKLTKEQVLEIRRLYATGEWTYQKLADKYCVSYTCIKNIVKRYTWKHI